MGKYGEFIAIKEFKAHAFRVGERGGNLTSYDFIVNNQKIEVRTSELKHERAFPNDISAWGWKLQTRDRKGREKPIGYDFIVLVQLLEPWNKYALYLFSKSEIEKMPATYFRGYQSVARVLYLFKNRKHLENAIKSESKRKRNEKMITRAVLDFNKNPKKHLLHWQRVRRDMTP
ncbi:hypothetical protein COU36_02700 [Candidatus Micrarchaeota archaeon CG10_big_fil_rev_8_21_14_0_10_59_7]|nr:MAG: hypothetical protein COU36_02700 [Candidatus Micrarchaeota archaeon CG10_big_fil_rev_8_21_14_0_10_59_7]